MNAQQLVGLRENLDGPGLVALLQDLCTWLCVGGEQYIHQFEVIPYTAALLPLIDFPDPQVQILALRALALQVEQVPRGVQAVAKDSGVPLLLECASNLNFLDPNSEGISEELIKILAILSSGAHKAMVQHSAIPVVLSLAARVPSETSRYSCYNCVCTMVSVCTPENHDQLMEAMMHVVDVLTDKVGFLVRMRTAVKDGGQVNGQQNARVLADEQIVFVIVKCLCHLLDRIGLSQLQVDGVLNHSILSPAISLLVNVLDMTAINNGDGSLRRAVLSFFTAIFQSAPGTLLHILSHYKGWDALGRCASSIAEGSVRRYSHAAPDAANLSGLTFTMSSAHAASMSGRTTGLDAALDRDISNLALLDFLLLVLPSSQQSGGGGGDTNVVLTRPYHVWSWEDDFHNTVEYDEAISWRLEREYQRQRAVGKFIPCEVVHMIRYFVSFERMRQLTPQGALSRTVTRSPVFSHFLHTRSAASSVCSCQSTYSNNNSFSNHPSGTATATQTATPRARDRRKRRGGGGGEEVQEGWFSSMFSCCSGDTVKESPRRRNRKDSMINALDASAPLSIFRYSDTQLEMRNSLEGSMVGAHLNKLFGPILQIAQRTANPLILRHCSAILLRLLAIVMEQSPASESLPGSVSGSFDEEAFDRPQQSKRRTGSVVPPKFLFALQNDIADVLSYAISVCCTSQVERLLAVMSVKDLAAEGFDDSSTVPVHNYLASPSALNDGDPLSLVVTFSILGDLLQSACEATNLLVSLLGHSAAKRLMSTGCVSDLAFLGKHLQTTQGIAEHHCPRHSSKLYSIRAIMDTIHVTFTAIQAAAEPSPIVVPELLPHGSALAFPTYEGVDSASSPPHSSRDDAACPDALRPVWRLYKNTEVNGLMDASNSGAACLACASVEALKSGGVVIGGTRTGSGRQALLDYFATKDGEPYRLGLQKFAGTLMRDLSNRLPPSGTFVADSFNITKGPQALNTPNSITSFVLMDKALKPIGLRILPLTDPPSSAAADRDSESIPKLVIPGHTPLKLLAIPKSIREFTLHTFAFASIGQIAEEITTRYNDSIDTSFPGMLQRPQDDWISESISTMISTTSQQRRRSTSHGEPDEADTLHPNQFPNSDGDSTYSAPMIGAGDEGSSQSPPSAAAPAVQWPRINPKQILLFINRVPILDRSMSFLDALLRNELTAGGMRRLLESVPSQYNRALVQQALSLWNHTYRLTFVVLETPLDMDALPSEYGCHCGLVSEPPLASANATPITPASPIGASPSVPDTSSMVEGVTTSSITPLSSVLTVRPSTPLYKVDQVPVCSPWHLFANTDKELQDHWVVDALRLLEQLIDYVITPFDPSILSSVGQRLYSVLLQNCKLQTISFTLPALSQLVHPSIRSVQHALSPSTPRNAEGLAEYILWNYPSVLPLPVRILYFNHISGSRGSATAKGANKGGGGRVVGGGGWALPTRNRNQVSPKKIKVSVRRDNLLADAEEVLTTYALCPLPLDIEFEGEPGSGVGPTVEFFSLVAKELTAYSSEMWSTEAEVISPSPIAPASPILTPPEQTDKEDEGEEGETVNTSFTDREKSSLVYDEKAEKRHQTEQYASGRLFPRFPPTPRGIRNFALLGHLIARGLQDGRTMNMWLHPVFLDRLLGKSVSVGGGHYDSSISTVLPHRSSVGSFGSSAATAASYPTGATSSVSSRHLSYLMNRVDPQMEKSLQSLLAMKEEELSVMDLVFTVPGTDDTVPLCEGGQDLSVTKDNVGRYCDVVRYSLCITSLDIPARTTLEGLNRSSIIPGHLRLFTGPEFEVLLSGHRGKVWATEEQLRRDVTCAHGYNIHSRAIQFFITAVVGFSAELQRRFLLFISGSDCLPAGGLNPPIQIVRKGLDPEASPIRKRRVKSAAVSPASAPSMAPVFDMGESQGSLGASPSVQSAIPPSLLPLNLPPAGTGFDDNPIPEMGGSASGSQVSSSRSLQPSNLSFGAGTKPITLEGEEEVEVRLTTQEQVDECLPTVNTCFHYLKLPDYSTEDVLRNRLQVAVYEGQGTFQLS